MKELACGIDDVDIVYEPGKCRGNAMVIPDEKTGKKTIYVGGKFFKYEYQDQMSILYHEAYHCNHDEAWSSKTQMLLDSPYNLQIPPEHVDYLLKYEFDGITNSMDFINEYEAKITILYCPEYYKNEINAYSVEIRLNPSVSEKYALGRLYML